METLPDLRLKNPTLKRPSKTTPTSLLSTYYFYFIFKTALAQAASNKLQRNQALLDDANVLCAAVEEEYEAATQGRRNELIIIAELERLVERRAAEFAEGH